MDQVANSLSQDGNNKAGMMPIKNRVNALDVSVFIVV
jgi:hypothetical protein